MSRKWLDLGLCFKGLPIEIANGGSNGHVIDDVT